MINKAATIGGYKRCTPDCEVEAILAYNNELEDDCIVWFHSDVPNDMWVFGNERMQHNLKDITGGLPVSVDPKFNHGAFEVTPLTYRHKLIKSKSKNVNGRWTEALMIGPTIIHHKKTEDGFDIGMRTIARKTDLTSSEFGIITDGETALIKACRTNFPKSKDLRCTNHFKENCKDFLKSIGVCGELKQAPLMDFVFGTDGFIESENKDDLKERLQRAEPLMVEIEEEILGEGFKEDRTFHGFLTKREKKVLRKLIRDRRREGGMHLDSSGIPERVYTNQSESCNSILAAKKQSIGHSKTEDLSKGHFLKNAWQSAVNEQG